MALIAGFVAYGVMFALHFVVWMRAIPLPAVLMLWPFPLALPGVPTFGGAEIPIPLFNHAVWGAPAALVHAGVMRWGLGGRICRLRLGLLCLGTLALGYLVALYARTGVISPGQALNLAYLIWFLAGTLIVRDWMARS